ncbi:hypothetical protein KM1_022790 [Entamoeba histolytica HM-3:IMSS]|uniref:Ricin B lectin domain-containing protein n=2 Tax=Entamoeba histolytica TaxID=5759 RepID=M2RHT8_ENTHI|nr:Hypothetical protein EHI5A_028690 [Entamoeba histolytica KU27]EMS16466.1 hypothetical protein KM1_022790 [Entamoeba histolytica HM-3:IMSS]
MDGNYLRRVTQKVQEINNLIFDIKILNYTGTVKEEVNDFKRRIDLLELKIKALPKDDNEYEQSSDISDFENELEIIENELNILYQLEKEKTNICFGIISTEIYEIIPRCAPKLRIDIAGGQNYDGVNALTFYSNDQENQMFQLIKCKEPGHTCCVLIRAVHSGKFLGREDGNNYFGVNVCQTNANPNDETNHWFIESFGKGIYIIICSHANLALDIKGGSDKSETNVICWERHEELNQQFILQPIDPIKSELFRRKLLEIKPSTESLPFFSSVKQWFQK